MPAPFFIVGPTAVGKSTLAVEVAARCGAEIVGADAFQVYAGFDALTAKPSPEDRQRVPHHLIGTVSPTETFNVALYLEQAQRTLESIASRGKQAIVVGGTGLYVKALTHGLSPLPEGSPTLRAELEPLDSPTLLNRLRVLDPLTADTIDQHNRRRLIRAVEVCFLTGKPFSSYRTLWQQSPSTAQPNGVFLFRTKAALATRIEHRMSKMFAGDAVEEVRAAQSLIISPTAERMIGFHDIQEYLRGRQSLVQCREKMALATRQYAKRQVTWFQREQSFEKLDLTTLVGAEAQIRALSGRLDLFAREA